jgi:hypothetical protein
VKLFGGKEGVSYSAGIDAGVNAVKDFYACSKFFVGSYPYCKSVQN